MIALSGAFEPRCDHPERSEGSGWLLTNQLLAREGRRRRPSRHSAGWKSAAFGWNSALALRCQVEHPVGVMLRRFSAEASCVYPLGIFRAREVPKLRAGCSQLKRLRLMPDEDCHLNQLGL